MLKDTIKRDVYKMVRGLIRVRWLRRAGGRADSLSNDPSDSITTGVFLDQPSSY
jgi:hypothetical protein